MTVHDLPSRDRWLTLLDAVYATPPRHDCPGLADCIDHPRWRVVVQRGDGRHYGRGYAATRLTLYHAYPPRSGTFEAAVLNHAEAMDIATEQARPRCQWCGDRLTWLDDGTWQGDTHLQCPDSQDGPDDDHGNVVHSPRPADLAALRRTR